MKKYLLILFTCLFFSVTLVKAQSLSDVVAILRAYLQPPTATTNKNGDTVVNILDFTTALNLITSPTTPPQPTFPPTPISSSWTQQAGNAQRTGYTPEEPRDSSHWTFAWHWKPQTLNLPRQAQAVVSNGLIFIPAGNEGLYAINISNGSVAWNSRVTQFEAAGAYDPSSQSLFIGGKDGKIYKFNSSGQPTATYQTPNGGYIDKATLIANNAIFVVDSKGYLYRLNSTNLSLIWSYNASDIIDTPPTYSASRDIVIFGTRNLFVHGINANSGTPKWPSRKISTNLKSVYEDSCSAYSFNYGWPVVADTAGVFFIRIRLGHENDYLFSTGPKQKYPLTNPDIKSFLENTSIARSVFALSLDTGQNSFTPALGSGGIDGDVFPCKLGPFDKTIGPMPVIKTFSDGSQRGYSVFRNGQTADVTFAWDNRWDGHMGEMNLTDNPATAYDERGDLKFIHLNTSIGNGIIVDEFSPTTVAGNMLFYSHWGAVTSSLIPSSYSQTGNTLADEIPAISQKVILRRIKARGGVSSSDRSYADYGELFCDTRTWQGSGFWVFYDQMDGGDQACIGDYYGDGMRPRYTFVASGYIFVIGNGGDVFALKYN